MEVDWRCDGGAVVAKWLVEDWRCDGGVVVARWLVVD